MSEDAPAKQVNGECLATGRGKVRGLGPEPLLDVRGQVDVKTDVHDMFLSFRAGRLGFGHDPRWDEVGQPAAGREEAAEHQVQRNLVRRRFDLGDPGLARPDPLGQLLLREMVALPEPSDSPADYQPEFDDLLLFLGQPEEIGGIPDFPTGRLQGCALLGVHDYPPSLLALLTASSYALRR